MQHLCTNIINNKNTNKPCILLFLSNKCKVLCDCKSTKAEAIFELSVS